MTKKEKSVVLSTFIITMLYVALFIVNDLFSSSNSLDVVPFSILMWLLVIGFLSYLLSLIVCIRDSGNRKLENREAWIFYMIFLGVIGIAQYYFKYGRYNR